MDRISCTWPNQTVVWGPQLIETPKTLVWSETDFDFRINSFQPAPGKVATFVHIDVFFWSAGVFKRLMHLWRTERWRLPPIVFAGGDICDAKWLKFITKLGFEPLIDVAECTDGQTRPIFVHYHRGNRMKQ